jgi:serine protease
MMVPDDLGYPLQWHFNNSVYGGINMEAAWDMVTGRSSVVVAVVDTGVAYEDNAAPSYWHIDTYQAYSGHSWWCGVSSAPYSWTGLYGSTAAPGYGNGWKEYLQRTFDLASATAPVTFSYQYRCDLENGYDFAFVEVSSDGGYNWVQLKNYTSYGSSSPPPKVQWRSDSLDLSSYIGSEVLVRFRVFSDEIISDEDYDYDYGPGVKNFDSDGAFFVDEISLTDGGGTIFYDDVESGASLWVTTSYERAPDLAGTSFWVNAGEIAGNSVDDDGNGFDDDVGGWDFVNNDEHPNDDNGHGTHVCGTVAQTTNNGFGVAGIAFRTTVMPVKVLNAAGTGTHQWIADGIQYAVDKGADIINLSLGGPSSTTLENAVAYAYNSGVVVFAASGNDGAGSVDYPAAYDDYVIAVGATQYDETRAPYSNYGSSLDIVAPGGNTAVDQNIDGYADGVLQNTFSDTPVDWSYWFFQGTSMSTPHVSGVAALLLARNSTLTPDDIRSVLESTAEDLGTAGWDSTYGWGLLDAKAALKSIAEPVHLLLSVAPFQDTFAGGQSLTLTVTIFNELNPRLDSTLTLTVTGPSSYYLDDFQPIAVAANEVKDYSFDWVVPEIAGTYVVEVGLVHAQLTAYDVRWLEVA